MTSFTERRDNDLIRSDDLIRFKCISFKKRHLLKDMLNKFLSITLEEIF